MAASTCSSANHTRFDVFLSFRGEDTRHSFTDHLYAALKRAGIPTFRDDDEIDRGQELKPEIERAIKESRASIVVLSENYAKSRWCLDELVLILEQRRNFNHFVLPVFYRVDPSDVRNQRQAFAIQAEDGSKWTEVNVNKWQAALTEVANLTGMPVSGPETESITNIIDTVDCELDLKLVSTSAHLTGMEARAEGINYWLKNEQSGAQILAICGMGGSGKSTLAKYIYNSNKQNFESSSFVEEIGKHWEQSHGLIGLQNQLVTDILGGKKERTFGVSEGTVKIEKALQVKRVLIVLDDVDDQDQISTLLGTKAFHTQSKIIITTRHLEVHAWFEPISWECRVHKVKLLNGKESLELLSCHAFGSKVPLEGFEELAIKLAEYCEGNPLALKVLGSSLFVTVEERREIVRVIEIWKSRLNSLSSFKGDLDSKIQVVLQKSFDSLPCASHKELFLHIAIFFVGEDEDYVVNILEHDWHAKAGIKTLIDRCLVTVSSNKKLMMHQLLQDMGRHIVRLESNDPAERTRVWCSDEAYRVLTKGEGSKTIQGLALDFRKIKKGTKASALKTGWLAKMDKLKLLQLKYVRLTGTYKDFPELRWLCWHGCHLRTIPSGLMASSLVAIDMSYGILEKFEPPRVLNSLKILNLKSCRKLISIHNLHRLPNLETLILWKCRNLTHVCKTIGGLESLTLLNLAGCKKLWKVSSKALCIGGGIGIQEQPLFSLPKSLKFLFLKDCNLKYNNDVRVGFHGLSLFGLSLCGNPFKSLPTNIDLKMLRVLNLNSCKNLKYLLCLPSTLEELYAYRCKSLEKITFQSGRFRLKKFRYKGCIKLSEVEGLFKLVSVSKLDEEALDMQWKWIKAYQDQTVDLVGDNITEGRTWHIQMLYEYGIMSTYLHGINDPSMTVSQYMSSDPFLSFDVPLDLKKRKIRGLIVTVLYRSSSIFKVTQHMRLFAKISNRTKGVTWIYNPLIYCKPRVKDEDEDVMWLSYWPIGNIFDVGDQVFVDIILDKALMVTGCGASLVDMDVGEEKLENNMKMEQVDLSEFELQVTTATGVYYLCRRDFFQTSDPVTSSWLEILFGDTINYKVLELQGWRKSHQSRNLDLSFMVLTCNTERYRDTLYKEIWLGYFKNSCESEIRKIKKVVSRLGGVDLVEYDTEAKKLFVSGLVDCITVESCVREFENKAMILSVMYMPDRLLKRCHKKIVLWRYDRNNPYYYRFLYMCSTNKRNF